MEISTSLFAGTASLMAQQGQVQQAGAAQFTLLGVAITAGVSLVALFVKHILDASAAKRSHDYELRVEKMKLEENRKLKLLEQTRRIYADFLSGTAGIYREIVMIRRTWRETRNDEDYRRSMNAISPNECQVSLEEVRLQADREVVDLADTFWQHLRSAEVSTGADLSSRGWVQWKDEYWRLRSELVSKLRESVVQEAL